MEIGCTKVQIFVSISYAPVGTEVFFRVTEVRKEITGQSIERIFMEELELYCKSNSKRALYTISEDVAESSEDVPERSEGVVG